RLEELGHVLADQELDHAFARFKTLADRKKQILDADLVSLMKDTSSATNGSNKPVRVTVSVG
ncbi:MAG TPA: hypothetical protein PKD72_15870, partial [Gemmatales bacterium]|nr:hypothetical protein [Gemmatales bacterium]